MKKEIITDVIIFVWGIIFMVAMIFLIFSVAAPGLKQEICDYDSCSQEIYKWKYNGSVCFDDNNLECQDFLRLWRVCQEYKKRLGVC